MAQLMASGTVRLKGRELLERYDISMYRIAKDGEVSYPTVHKYLTNPESIQTMSGEVLYGILAGMGLTAEEMENMRLGDVFEFVPRQELAAE